MVVFLEPVSQGNRIVIDKAVVLFGRHEDCDVVLENSRKVSRRHCCIAQVNETLLIRDLGSMNGVTVNGQRVRREARLALGDQVTIGDLEYVLRSQALPNAKPAGGRPANVTVPTVAVEPPPRPFPAPREISQEYPVALPDDFGIPLGNTPLQIAATPPAEIRTPGKFTPRSSSSSPPSGEVYVLQEDDEIKSKPKKKK